MTDFPLPRYTIIDNTSANPVVGTFAGLPEGSVLTIGVNRYWINYQGNGPSGGGNDVVLNT